MPAKMFEKPHALKAKETLRKVYGRMQHCESSVLNALTPLSEATYLLSTLPEGGYIAAVFVFFFF